MTSDPVRAPGVAAGSSGVRATATVLDAVADLRSQVAEVRFPLAIPGAAAAEAERRSALEQLDEHLLPRLRALSAPGVVVVAGSTGAGKSTIVNSLLGEEVSAAGVLRPTTRRPVLVHHPADAAFLADHPLRDVVDVVAHQAAPRGLVIVDAPDLDSLETANRDLAQRLLAGADLWLFTTTATRYGDAVPWESLDGAARRGTSLAMVLNRVPEAALDEIRRDLMSRLHGRGMVSVPLFLITDRGPHEGLLAPAAVAPIRRWLATVAGPDRARSVITRTQRGALADLRPRVRGLGEAAMAQADAAAALARLVDEATERAAHGARERIGTGTIAEGAVRGRWSQVAAALGGGRRARAGVGDALAALRADLESAATVALAAAREEGRRTLVRALEGAALPGAANLTAALEAEGSDTGSRPEDARSHADRDQAPTPEASAAAWIGAAGQVLRLLEGGTAARAVARLGRRLGPDGAATVVAASAAGLGAAGALLTEAVGPGAAHEVVTAGVAELARRAADLAVTAARPARDLLASPHLAPEAGVDLRLRLAVLEGLS